MIHYIRLSALFLLLLTIKTADSQNSNIKFGDIPISDLEMKVYLPECGADAVILLDKGKADLVYNGGFEIVLNRDVRIKIINKNGFDYANVEIPCFTSDIIDKVEASTFNLENGNIVETKILKKEFVTDKANKVKRILRIAFPNVHEGSVLEYKYRHTTKYIHEFVPWEFQSDIPVQFSEFNANYPVFLNYRGVIKGNTTKIAKESNSKDVFFGGYSTTENNHKWVGANIPSFKEEPFITGASDHLIKLEFELEGVNFPGRYYEEIAPTYASLSKKLFEREDFGISLSKTSFLKKQTNSLMSGISDDLDKLKKIHQFVSNKILWNGQEDYTSSKPLRQVFKEERGNSAEINMILIAMLRQAGLTVDPVVLSTRSNGSLHPTLAMIQQLNYLVAKVLANGNYYIVDATDPLRPFNTLPFDCLNDKGRIIHPTISEWVKLSNNEKSISSSFVNFSINEKGIIDGNVQNNFSHYDAYSKRKFIKLESVAGYKDYIKSNYANLTIKNIQVQNIDSIDNNLIERFDFKSDNNVQTSSIGLILNPFILGKIIENPFSSEERKYPINFGCPIQNTFTINIVMPNGFELEEKPSNISVKLPSNGGGFLFNCEQRDNIIIIQGKFYIDQIQFIAGDYKTLREFFAQVIKKQSELIVLKKKV